MESNSETMGAPRYPVVSKADVTSLRKCADLMGPIERISFDSIYGNLRKLLSLKVQTEAIAALSRFYDSEIRCFLFKNFQLAPTLEEYRQILGFHRAEVVPYRYQEEYYTDEKLAALLQIKVEDLKLQKQKKNQVIGFQQSYLEGLMGVHAKNKNWLVFKQILAMTIFGIVLFPQIERFIDVTIIGIFIASQSKKSPVDPIPAILADTYTALTHHCKLKRKKISCSSHLLYAWLLIHVYPNSIRAERLIDYSNTCEVRVMSIQEWVRFLGSLDEHSIRWYLPSCWEDRPEVVFRCGGFQNVPLMGTKGCINYNPSLVLRQLGYPMRSAPTEEMVSSFYIYEGSERDDSLVRKVLQAWSMVTYYGKAGLPRKTTGIAFAHWLKERIQKVQLPYRKELQNEREEIDSSAPVAEELGDVKLALKEAEEKNKVLQVEIEKLTQSNQRLREDNASKSAIIGELDKRCKEGEKEKIEAQRYWQAAKEEAKRQKARGKSAIEEIGQWRDLHEKAKMEEKIAKGLLAKSKRELRLLQAEWKDKMSAVMQERESVESLLKDYKQALEYEREISDELKRNLRHVSDAYRQVKDESRYWEHRYVELLGRIEEQAIIIELKEEIQHWKTRFSELAELASQALSGVPKRLRTAECEMSPFNTPVAVYKFVEYCRALVEGIKEKAKKASVGSKRKRTEEFRALCN